MPKDRGRNGRFGNFSTAVLTPREPGRIYSSAVFRVVPPDKSPVRLKFRPFYDVMAAYPYAMYFDRKTLPYRLW